MPTAPAATAVQARFTSFAAAARIDSRHAATIATAAFEAGLRNEDISTLRLALKTMPNLTTIHLSLRLTQCGKLWRRRRALHDTVGDIFVYSWGGIHPRHIPALFALFPNARSLRLLMIDSQSWGRPYWEANVGFEDDWTSSYEFREIKNGTSVVLTHLEYDNIVVRPGGGADIFFEVAIQETIEEQAFNVRAALSRRGNPRIRRLWIRSSASAYWCGQPRRDMRAELYAMASCLQGGVDHLVLDLALYFAIARNGTSDDIASNIFRDTPGRIKTVSLTWRAVWTHPRQNAQRIIIDLLKMFQAAGPFSRVRTLYICSRIDRSYLGHEFQDLLRQRRVSVRQFAEVRPSEALQ